MVTLHLREKIDPQQVSFSPKRRSDQHPTSNHVTGDVFLRVRITLHLHTSSSQYIFWRPPNPSRVLFPKSQIHGPNEPTRLPCLKKTTPILSAYRCLVLFKRSAAVSWSALRLALRRSHLAALPLEAPKRRQTELRKGVGIGSTLAGWLQVESNGRQEDQKTCLGPWIALVCVGGVSIGVS